MSEALHYSNSEHYSPAHFAYNVLETVANYDFSQSPRQELTIALASQANLIDSSYLPSDSKEDLDNSRAIFEALGKGYDPVPLFSYVDWNHDLHKFSVAWLNDGSAIFTNEVRFANRTRDQIRFVNSISFSREPNQTVLAKVAKQQNIPGVAPGKEFRRVALPTVHTISDRYVLDAIAGKHGFDRAPHKAKSSFLGKIGLSK